MPEAPVHENSDALFRKNKIRFAEYLPVSAPANDACLLEEPNESKFGSAIATAANARHDRRAFCRVENVSAF